MGTAGRLSWRQESESTCSERVRLQCLGLNGGISALTGRVPSRSRAAGPDLGRRRAARRAAVPTLQGAAPSRSVSSGDARATAGTWSSSSGSRNGRSGDQAITAWAQARRREQTGEGAAFNPVVALPLGRTRLPGPTPLGAGLVSLVSAIPSGSPPFQPSPAPTRQVLGQQSLGHPAAQRFTSPSLQPRRLPRDVKLGSISWSAVGWELQRQTQRGRRKGLLTPQSPLGQLGWSSPLPWWGHPCTMRGGLDSLPGSGHWLHSPGSFPKPGSRPPLLLTMGPAPPSCPSPLPSPDIVPRG